MQWRQVVKNEQIVENTRLNVAQGFRETGLDGPVMTGCAVRRSSVVRMYRENEDLLSQDMVTCLCRTQPFAVNGERFAGTEIRKDRSRRSIYLPQTASHRTPAADFPPYPARMPAC